MKTKQNNDLLNQVPGKSQWAMPDAEDRSSDLLKVCRVSNTSQPQLSHPMVATKDTCEDHDPATTTITRNVHHGPKFEP
jgi:hypothetical protein